MPAKLAPPRKRPSKARGIIKVASLGLVGFIAGLLTDARPPADNGTRFPLHSAAVWPSTADRHFLPAVAHTPFVKAAPFQQSFADLIGESHL